MRCAYCGNQASWRVPTCKKCSKPLHQNIFKSKSFDSKYDNYFKLMEKNKQ